MSSLQELRAVAHPLRLRLLSLLTGAALSAAEAGRELGLPQANVSYHLRVLEQAGVIAVVETERVRGGDAKRYRYVPPVVGEHRPGPGGAAASEEQERYTEAIVDELRRRSSERAAGPRTTTDAELWVRPEVWRQVVAQVEEAAVALHAAARPRRTPGTRPVSMTAVLFTMRTP